MNPETKFHTLTCDNPYNIKHQPNHSSYFIDTYFPYVVICSNSASFMKFKCLLFELQILKKFLKSCFTKNPYLKLVLFSRNVCIWWSLIKSWNFRKFNIPCRIEKEWPGISFRRIWIFDTMCCGFNNTIWKVTHHITNIHDKNVLFGFYLNPFAFWILILALNKKIHLPSYWHHLRLDSITENRPWLPNRLFDPDSKLSKILGQCVHRRPSLLELLRCFQRAKMPQLD